VSTYHQGSFLRLTPRGLQGYQVALVTTFVERCKIQTLLTIHEQSDPRQKKIQPHPLMQSNQVRNDQLICVIFGEFFDNLIKKSSIIYCAIFSEFFKNKEGALSHHFAITLDLHIFFFYS